MTIHIEPRHDLSAVEIDSIENHLDSYNGRATGRRDSRGLGFVIRDAAGRTIAATAGYFWAGISELKQMWVDEAHRGRGYARQLLDAFVAEAGSRGVLRIWVSSYDFQAPGMYEKAGFKRVAEFAGWPEGHTNVILCKTLVAPQGASALALALPPDRSVRIARYDGDRSELKPLFALADDSSLQIAGYSASGEVLVARARHAIIGHSQIVETEAPSIFELKSIAVAVEWQGNGVGRMLVQASSDRCREKGGRRLIVSTAAADIGNLRFYQRQGFRMYKVVQNAFTPQTGYAAGQLVGGIPLRDQVFLELEL